MQQPSVKKLLQLATSLFPLSLTTPSNRCYPPNYPNQPLMEVLGHESSEMPTYGLSSLHTWELRECEGRSVLQLKKNFNGQKRSHQTSLFSRLLSFLPFPSSVLSLCLSPLPCHLSLSLTDWASHTHYLCSSVGGPISLFLFPYLCVLFSPLLSLSIISVSSSASFSPASIEKLSLLTAAHQVPPLHPSPLPAGNTARLPESPIESP